MQLGFQGFLKLRNHVSSQSCAPDVIGPGGTISHFLLEHRQKKNFAILLYLCWIYFAQMPINSRKHIFILDKPLASLLGSGLANRTIEIRAYEVQPDTLAIEYDDKEVCQYCVKGVQKAALSRAPPRAKESQAVVGRHQTTS